MSLYYWVIHLFCQSITTSQLFVSVFESLYHPANFASRGAGEITLLPTGSSLAMLDGRSVPAIFDGGYRLFLASCTRYKSIGPALN